MADLVFNGVHLTGVNFVTLTTTLTTVGIFANLYTVPVGSKAVILRSQKYSTTSVTIISVYLNTGGLDYPVVPNVGTVNTDCRYVFAAGESVTAMMAQSFGAGTSDVTVSLAVFPDTNPIYSDKILTTLPVGTFPLHSTLAVDELAMYVAAAKINVTTGTAGVVVNYNGNYLAGVSGGLTYQFAQTLQLGLVSGDLLEVVSGPSPVDQWVFVTMYTP